MPRFARVFVPGAPVHVTDRAAEGRPLFVTDEDRAWLVARAARIFREENVRCLAFALMTNHWHFLLVPARATLDRAMLRLKVSAARRYRRLCGERGPVFQGRYHTNCLAERDEEALATVLRYILLNPLEAGIVSTAPGLAAWPWTSAPELLGTVPPSITDVRTTLRGLAAQPHAARVQIAAWLDAAAGCDAPRGADGGIPARIVLPARAVADARMREGITGVTGPRAAAALCSGARPRSNDGAEPADMRRARRAAMEAAGWRLADLVTAASRRFRADEALVRSGGRTVAQSRARALAVAVAVDLLGVPAVTAGRATGVGSVAACRARDRGRRLVAERRVSVEELLRVSMRLASERRLAAPSRWNAAASATSGGPPLERRRRDGES